MPRLTARLCARARAPPTRPAPSCPSPLSATRLCCRHPCPSVGHRWGLPFLLPCEDLPDRAAARVWVRWPRRAEAVARGGRPCLRGRASAAAVMVDRGGGRAVPCRRGCGGATRPPPRRRSPLGAGFPAAAGRRPPLSGRAPRGRAGAAVRRPAQANKRVGPFVLFLGRQQKRSTARAVLQVDSADGSRTLPDLDLIGRALSPAAALPLARPQATAWHRAVEAALAVAAVAQAPHPTVGRTVGEPPRGAAGWGRGGVGSSCRSAHDAGAGRGRRWGERAPTLSPHHSVGRWCATEKPKKQKNRPARGGTGERVMHSIPPETTRRNLISR